ncbi:MAG: hypothetical protein IIZ61_08195 [Lachnospiraceae bacterium]|nr:hypothetical protein [Lachnospiraceae bacterium]
MRKEWVKKENILMAAAVIFAVYFLMKIFGFFDYTHKFGIREIITDRDKDSVTAMLDNEDETVWGDAVIWNEPLAEPGEKIDIIFDGTRSVKGITLSGEVPEGIVISTKTENGDFSAVDYDMLAENSFSLKEDLNTDALRIQVPEDLKEGEYFYVSELTVF